MPLEIRELTIKVAITQPSTAMNEVDIYRAIRNMKAELVNDCVEKVFKKIKKAAER